MARRAIPALAYRINGLGTQNVALAAAQAGAAMLYISTNEVFDGAGRSPYAEFDHTRPDQRLCPLQAGRRVVRHASAARAFTWRAPRGSRPPAGATSSIASCNWPTSAAACAWSPTRWPTRRSVEDLADALLKLIATEPLRPLPPDQHRLLLALRFCPRKCSSMSGRQHVPLEPITLADYPRASPAAALRAHGQPAAAALGISLRPWQAALAEFLKS